jgi:serine/threonine protein kinase
MYPGSEGASTSPAPASQGRIGRYDLLRRLGSGGMAEVHLVRAAGIEGFEKLLVLKRILPHLAADPHFVRMFLAEARLAAILDHPHVVQVFDLGRDERDFFFTMEFVYGETLHSAVRAARRAGEKFPYELAVAVAVGAASGLHYAHERVGFDGQPLNIVHRDVSPTNVMITFDGCVKVADFGIAKVANRTDVTRAGMRKGKVPYMSPEQCRAEKLDRRSDVFALGIVLYECSTMHRLFDGDNEFGVMNRIVNGDFRSPSTMRSGYPKELERIVMKALSVDKSSRYASAHDMMLDLERFARECKLDASVSALGRWMHRMFQPEPFPWGALQQAAMATSSATGLSTLSDAAQSLESLSASGPGLPQSHPGVTPSSHPSWASPPSHPSFGAPRTGVKKGNRLLRGIAIGLGGLAAVTAIGVGGAIFYAKVIVPRSADGSGTAPAATAVDAAPEPTRAVAPVEPLPPAPKLAPEPEPEPAPEPEGEADRDAAFEPEPPPEEEEEIVVVEEPDASRSRSKPKAKGVKVGPRSRTTAPEPKPKPKPESKPDKKGTDIDAFMPGG